MIGVHLNPSPSMKSIRPLSLIAIGLIASFSTFAAVPTSRPNVLLILAEDIGPQLACYGEPLVSTPLSIASRRAGCGSPARLPPHPSARPVGPRS